LKGEKGLMDNEKIKNIYDSLIDIQEKLLALPDDILLEIDPRDNESLENGIKFLKNYNNNLADYSKATSKITENLRSYFKMNPEDENIEGESTDIEKRKRIIQELDKTKPYTLEENFTYKRPYGFILENSAYKGLKTWKSLYLKTLEVLKENDKDKFKKLPEVDDFISRRGNFLFSKSKNNLRVAEKFNDYFYVEVNLSANHIRNTIKQLLIYFSLDPADMKIYLREDRDV
jgi:hypothetical protein